MTPTQISPRFISVIKLGEFVLEVWSRPLRCHRVCDVHVASVIATNGTGHFRRSIGVMHRVTQEFPSIRVTIYCGEHQLAAMRGWWRLAQLSELGARFVTEIDCGFRWPIRTTTADLLSWRDRLADQEYLIAADLVVSDNLASVLAIRPDTVLMGSFLWSDVLANVDQEWAQAFVTDELSYLRKYRPPMLCVKGIVTPGVLRETSAVQLPWMCEQPATEPRTLSSTPRIGISGGTTDAAADQALHIAKLLSPRYAVVVDSAVDAVSVSRLAGVRTGLQKEVSLTEVDIILCRPGAGTVMDCVAANVPFLTFFEPDSPEMAHSAARLAEMGIADTLGSAFSDEMVLAAAENLAAPQRYSAASAKIDGLPKDGLEVAAHWLVEHQLNKVEA